MCRSLAVLMPKKLYHDTATGTDKSILSTTGRGYYILGLIDPNHEPTNHALRDIARVKAEFESWGRPMLLLYADSNAAMRQETADMPQLPLYSCHRYGYRWKNIRRDLQFIETQSLRKAHFHHRRYIQPHSIRIARIHNKSRRHPLRHNP